MRVGKKFSHFSVNIDTIRSSSEAELLVPVSNLTAQGWRYHVGSASYPNSYTKFASNIYLEYYPLSGFITATLSAPKIMTGSNTGHFDFGQVDLFFDAVSILINNMVRGLFRVPSYRLWNVTRLDINVDIPFLNNTQKQIFIDYFSKFEISRRTKTNYASGSQYKNKSLNITAYDKEQEICDREPTKVTDLDNLFLTDTSATHLRLEFQIKRTKLNNLFKKARSLEVLLTRQNIDSLYLLFIKEFKLESRIFTKDVLFEFLDKNFNPVKARNMKRLIEDLNELTPEEFEKAHKVSTKNAYAKLLHNLDVSIYYFSMEPNFVVDFVSRTIFYGRKPKLTLDDVILKVVELIAETLIIENVHNFEAVKLILPNHLTHQYPDRGS